MPDPPGSRSTVYIVRVRDQLEVFDDRDSAATFARQDPEGTVETRPLRHSIDAARVVHSQRVVVRNGDVERERHEQLIEFYDDEFQPPTVEVEAFEGEHSEWHIHGHGTDGQALSTAVIRVVDRIANGMEQQGMQRLD